jgi:sugar phosphate isomerase/epimerase
LFDQTNVAGCLDTGHAYVTGHGGAEQAELLAQYGERFSHIHLNDTRMMDDDEHLPVGMGQVEFTPLARTIRDTEWTGTCTHEIFAFDLESRALGKTAFNRLLDSG